MEGQDLKKYNVEYLERQLHNLTKLVEINGIINSTLDIARLLTLIMEIIKDIMEAEASTLLLYEEKSRDLVFKVALGEAGHELQERYRVSIGQGIAGWVAENRRAVFINDVYTDPRFDPNFDKKTGFTTRAILCAPLLFKGKLLGVIQAINPLRKQAFDEEDVTLFKAFANQAVLAVQNAIFFQNAIEEERIKNEIAAAHSIQQSLLPTLKVMKKNVQIAARSISAREVGGEFYDVFYYDDINSIGLALGDIHTKGIPGALQASIVSGAVKALSLVMGQNPMNMHRLVNDIIRLNLDSAKAASLFYGVLCYEDNSLTFVNAGHAYPLLLRNRITRYLKLGSKQLGENHIPPQKVRLELRSGDYFVIITDGLVNIKNRNGNQLGLRRVMEFLGKNCQSPEYIVSSLIGLADDFTGGIEMKEDITIIAIKID